MSPKYLRIAAFVSILAAVCIVGAIAQEADLSQNPTAQLPVVGDDPKPAIEVPQPPPARELPFVPDEEKAPPVGITRFETPTFPKVQDDAMDEPRPTEPVVTRQLPMDAPDDQKEAIRFQPQQTPQLPKVADDEMDEPKPFRPVQTPQMPAIPADDDPRPQPGEYVVRAVETPDIVSQPAGDTQNQRGEFIFDGAWLPDADPSVIGAKNYKVLQNLRYAEGPAGLEGIRGYSDINSTGLSEFFKIRSGIQLLSSYPDTSYVIVHAENTGETVSHVFHNKTAIPSTGNFVEVELHTNNNAVADYQTEGNSVSGWTADATGGSITSTTADPSVGTYHFDIEEATDAVDEGAMMDAGTIATVANKDYTCAFDVKVVSGSWTIDVRDSADSSTIATLETGMTTADYSAWSDVSYEWTASGTNERIRINTDVASAAQIYIDALSCNISDLHTDASSAGLGRFSHAPDSNIAYANGAESMIWAGDEMRAAAVFHVDKISVSTTEASDLTFVAGPPGTITTSGNVDWVAKGFEPGQHATITDATDAANIKDITIEDVTTTVITVSEALAAGGAGAYTMAAEVLVPRKHILDYTDAMNNDLSTATNTMTIGGASDTSMVLLLHMDGTHGGTTFTDNGATGHTVTANGDAQLTTADFKFGTASGEFDGTGDYLSIPDSDDWDFDANEFTIDFWYKTDTVAAGGHDGVWEIQTDDSNYIEMYRSGSTLLFSMRNGGTSEVYMGASGLKANTWHHVALIRGWGGDTDDWALCLDGVQEGLDPNEAHDVGNYTGTFNIGLTDDGIINGGAAAYMDGTIDEFRVIKGRAVWTENFTPPVRAYEDYTAGDVALWYVFSTRPLKGIEYYLSSVNDQTSTTSVKYWNGSSFEALTLINDGTSSGGVSLAQDGEMLFPSTVGLARPMYFEDLYLYAYLMELTVGSAEVYQITVNAPFQPVVDVWDGINRQPISFQFWDDSDAVYEDYTLEVNYDSDAANDYGATIGAMTTDDNIVVMFEDRITALKFVIVPTKANTNASLPTVEWWDGENWTSGGNVYDTTISNEQSWETFGQTGAWSWVWVCGASEKPRGMFGKSGYVYRLTVDATLSADVIIDRVYGVAAQICTSWAFRFPVMYQDMLLLCNNSASGQNNRCDYSMPGAPDVWNGDFTSMGGLQSLYFGGGEGLTAGAQLFNRYGSNVQTALLMMKDNETYLLTGYSPETFQIHTISDNIGCPAPHTLITAEVGFEVVQGAKRNVAIWLDYSGPVMFDGSVLHPINGIDKYFDPNDTEFIEYDVIERSHAYYDPLHKEYNLMIPTGDGETDVDEWLALDIRTLRWYEKVPATHLQASIPVIDSNGTSYVYGATGSGTDSGQLMRLDNGNDWSGGAMQIHVETGDFYPSGSMWDKTRIRRFKVAAADITEADDNLTITHYADTLTSGTALTALDLDSGTGRIVRDTQSTTLLGWSHRFKFTASTNSTGPDMRLFGWGYLFKIEREDL